MPFAALAGIHRTGGKLSGEHIEKGYAVPDILEPNLIIGRANYLV